MSDYDNDPRVQVDEDGATTVGKGTLREVPGDGWCLYIGDARAEAGFSSRDALLEEMLGPAVTR